MINSITDNTMHCYLVESKYFSKKRKIIVFRHSVVVAESPALAKMQFAFTSKIPNEEVIAATIISLSKRRVVYTEKTV